MHRFADDPPVERRLFEQLRDRGETVASAESFTGGLISTLLTTVPGSSDVFDRGVVAYSPDAKVEQLGVRRDLLETEGTVAASVAEAMAMGIRDVARTTWGVSTTGVAGPDPGSDGTPVGTAYVGLARREDRDSDGPTVTATHYEFDGSRAEIRERGARRALEELLDVGGSP